MMASGIVCLALNQLSWAADSEWPRPAFSLPLERMGMDTKVHSSRQLLHAADIEGGVADAADELGAGDDVVDADGD